MTDLPASKITQYIGHDKQSTTLFRSLQLGGHNAHHAWLFSGAKGIGKQTLAFLASHYLLAPINNNIDDSVGEMGFFTDEDSMPESSEEPTTSELLARLPIPDYTTSLSQQLRNNAHPNFYYIDYTNNETETKTQSIGVDVIRQLVEWLRLAPAIESMPRVVMIDGLDQCTNSAANALLKILEEPPLNCRFFLITARLSAVPRTILSRCMLLQFQNLTSDQCKQVLQGLDSELSSFHRDILAQLTQNSPGLSLYFHECGVVNHLESLWLHLSKNAVLSNDELEHLVAQWELDSDYNHYYAWRAVVDSLIHRQLNQQLTQKQPLFFNESEENYMHQTRNQNPHQWMIWYDEWQKLWYYGIQPYNCDKKQIMTLSHLSLYYLYHGQFDSAMKLLDSRV